MTNTLPTWVQRLLGIETGPGEGTAWGLDNTWGWPPWVTLLFVVLAVAFFVTLYLREIASASRPFRLLLAGIRLVLVGIVLVMLAQVVLLLSRTGLPDVAVLVDDSLSMTWADRYEGAEREKLEKRVKASGGEELTRWNLARTLMTERDGELLRRIRENYRLRVYFVTGLRPEEPAGSETLLATLRTLAPTGESTRLGAAVRGILDDLRGTTPAAIVLLTDGINTDGPELADAAVYARRRGVPLFAVGLGKEEPLRDLALSDLLAEKVIFAGDVAYFEAKLAGPGFEGRSVRVTLREEGKPEVLAETEVTVGPDGRPQQVRLPYRPRKEGEFRFTIEAEAAEEEKDTGNNRLSGTVLVSDKQIRVLLVQGYPSFEFRYLWNMLTRDSTIEVDAVLEEADPELVQSGEELGADQTLRAFPVRREELLAYDVVVLGDVDPAMLTPSMMQNLAEFVDQPGKGGALVFIAGPRYMPQAYAGTPLGRLMPVDPASVRTPEPGVVQDEGFVVRPTEVGLASPAMQLGDSSAETESIWRNLPPLYWMVDVEEPKPAARVLAVHPTRTDERGRPLPVILMQYVGAGKVLFHATDETWRWRWRVGDVFFARYWVQTIRYLARSKLSGGDGAALSTDRDEYERGEPVRLRVRFADERLAPAADDGVSVVVEHRGHKTRRIQLRRSAAGRGVFEGVLSDPAIGSYHAWMAVPTLEGRAPTADFRVKAPPGEFARIEMAAAELKRAAAATKGRFYTLDTARKLVDDLPQGRQVPIESLPPKPLWNHWLLLVVFLVLLVSEWILRKAGGMV